ncbi:hypothetical protein J4435_02920 [Candidatus Woesearchaeota archaeon]|nr:hypothetical protein [Candidatus Woesearchaeota archaeon]
MRDYEASAEYIKNQQKHHNIIVVDDRQRRLPTFTAEQDTATPEGVAE